MQLPVNSIWIQIGGFLIGIFIGSLILLATTKSARKRTRDPWEKMDEMDAQWEEEQSARQAEEETGQEQILQNTDNQLDITSKMCYTDTNAPKKTNKSSDYAQGKE